MAKKEATIYNSIIFLQTALHVSVDTLIHHQEYTQTVITSSGTGRTVRWRRGVVPTPPRQRTVANKVRPLPDVVITVWVCSWWWVEIPPEICRRDLQKYNKLCIVTSCWTIIDTDVHYCVYISRHLINNSSQLNMLREIILPIFRSTRLCVTACGMMHPRCCRPARSWVHYTTSCNTQSSIPEDGQNTWPKHVELTGIINRPLLLHLVGCLYYLYQWCTVKQISDN